MSESVGKPMSGAWQTRPAVIAVGVFIVSFTVYLMTLAPGLLMGGGDCHISGAALYGEIVSSILVIHLGVLAQPFVSFHPRRSISRQYQRSLFCIARASFCLFVCVAAHAFRGA
jgi:hypothetical protein